MKVLIIEDEPHARKELKRLLSICDDSISVIGELESVKESIAYLKEAQGFDLLFLDIQLSDGLSFDIFNEITLDKPVIFTTAYNEYALKAFELNSIDYLLKPVEPEMLQKALLKLKKQKQSEAPIFNGDELRAILGIEKRGNKKRFLVKIGDQFKQIPTADIAYFFADRNTIYLITHDNKKYIVDYKLDELEDLLDPTHFFRVTRSYIVNIQAITKIHKYFNSRLLIEVMPAVEEQLLVSRVKVDEFLKWMDQ